MPKYKHGKKTQLLSFSEVQEKVSVAAKHMTREALSFFWLLYYTGVRKSEAYERTVDDCSVSETHFILDFGKRKKGGAEVDPLEIPLWFPGIDLLCEQLEKARSKRRSRKLIERTVKKERSKAIVRARWLFPHVHRSWAAVIVKEILGDQYYPHFLRLNRITEICSDPTVNIARIKSFTGIKTIRVIEGYIGVSKKEQDKALDFMAKQIKENQQKGS